MASTQATDWENPLSYEDVSRSSTPALSIHMGILGSSISNSTATSALSSTGSGPGSGATTPELLENPGSFFQTIIPGLGTGIAAKSKACAAWAIILASHGRVADITMLVRRAGESGDDVDIHVQWNLKVGDLISQVEKKLTEIYEDRLRATPSLEGLYRDSESDETFHVVIPATAKSRELTFSGQTREGFIYIKAEGQHDLSDTTCAHIIKQYEHIIRQMCSPEGDEKMLVDLKGISIEDLNQVWAWNAQVPQAVEGVCIHRSFMDRAARHPGLPAVAAHDGDLSYRELDDLSTRLALALIQRGIKPKSNIIIFIEKSMWVPVAELAVMKCGCASVVFDVSLPFQRHKAIAGLVEAAGVLTSPDYEEQVGALGLECVQLTLSGVKSQSWPSSQSAVLPEVRDSDTLYICFTSGSTGTPKGSIISHANYASAVALQQKGLDFREFDRVFDFASYAFDAAWCNVIHALTIGGCLCIPSDEERKGDLPGALRKYKVNYAVLTPSVAWFPASELPDSLRTIHFGGEPLKAAMVKELSTRITVINAYGPAECSTVSTAVVADPHDDDDPSIGAGLGACTWVVNLDGSDLVAVGEIGELWIEGPIVGQGYLHEPEKTAVSFVENPSWLLRGCPSSMGSSGHPGRQGRLYRSGDLVRYGADGSLYFVGRKDSQVKIRGQRVELGEIEYNLERALTDESRTKNVQIVAEILKPEGSSSSTLVSFVFLVNARESDASSTRVILQQALAGIEDRLTPLVPPYMIPSAFIPVEEVPMTATGKINRRQLREMGSKLYWGSSESKPESETNWVGTELQTGIREVWAEVLNLPINNISLDSRFTRIGGDSISAMQVVSRCRAKKIAVSVGDILKHQTIRNIAQAAPLKQKRERLSHQRRMDDDAPFPLTPIQQIFFDNNPEGMNHYTLSYIVKLARHTTVDELSAALLAITARHAMLRARFRKHNEISGWEQLVAPPGPDSFHLRHHVFQDRETMQRVVDERQASMNLVNGPVFAIDLFDSEGEAQTLLMSAHHIVMDLVSWRILWHELGLYLSGKVQFPPLEISFQAWTHLQREEGERFQPREVLPFEIAPANFEYWGVRPEQLFFRDSVLHIAKVDIEATSLLLGASNNCFRTEIQDILVGALVFCFSQIFPDRQAPTVFLEGHGRESITGMDDLDLSEVIGWFTSLHPVSLGGRSSNSVLELIKFAKDTRMRIPGKGRPYFATRFYSETGRKAFETHKHPEVIFNYRGSFQQLEDANSMLQLEDRPDRNLMIPGDGPDYRRPSIIDINLVIQEGSLQVWTRSHKYMRNHDGVIRWVDMYPEVLRRVAHELAGLSASFTLMDFPLLDVSYDGLDTLVKQINQIGIAESLVQDIYPCTPMQEGILISSSLDRATYHTISIWEAVIDGQVVNPQRLQEAWSTVSRLHAVFSTIFSTNPDTGRFVQVVLSQPNEAVFVQAPESQSAVEYLRQLPQSGGSPSRPICFFTVCSGTAGDVACRLEMSHALMDALSLPIIVKDIEKAYMGQELSLRPHFRDYIAEIQRMSQSNHLSYWKNYLSDIAACYLPGDITPSQALQHPNTKYGWVTLPADITDSIAEICRETEITRSVFLHAAWSLVLAHFTGMRQVCFGYISSGRDLPVDGVEGMVGPLINMQIARVDLEKPLPSLLADLNQYHIEQLSHQHVSLAEIQHEISANRLFNTNITVREARGNAPVTGSGMRLVEVSEEDPHEYDLALSATLGKVHTDVSIQYRTDFVTSGNAQEIGLALEHAIKYLGSLIHQQAPVAMSSADSPGHSLYDAYFSHTFGTDETSALEQWKSHFKDIDTASRFPAVISGPSVSGIRKSASYTITNLTWRDDLSVKSQILASWALLVASYGNTRNVLVGMHSQSSNADALKTALPTPVRLVVDLNKTVSEYLSSVQSTIESHSRLPVLPFHRLRAIDDNSALAWDLPVVLSSDERLGNNTEHQSAQSGWETTRNLSVYFSSTECASQITCKFDEGSISSAHMSRIFSQLETVLRQLLSPANFSSKLLEMDTLSGQDFRQISKWNGANYDEVPGLVHDLISRTVSSMPDSLAISSWDGTLTYRQLDRFSTRLAHHLIKLGVGPEVIVPVYSEKSLWVAVCVVAIMKAGGAGVMIDCKQPADRINSIFSQVNARFVLVSKQTAAAAGRFSDIQLIIVNEDFLDTLPCAEQEVSLPNQVQPSNLLYVSFTSGSTGQPKGAMITHTCFASSIKHQQAALGFKAGRRVYDFASYSFDAAWSNLLHSLTSGSCLCVPSEEERQNELSKSIRDSKASLLNMTPSVLRHLDPRDLPDMEQVLMGGEAWAEADFLDWIDQTRLINSYGPGECTIKACLIRAFRGMVPNKIGFGIGLNTWIVRTDGSDRLAPLGSIGELWLEGPQVGRGYIADEARTAASFVTRPKWAQGIMKKPNSTQADGPQCRFYRTGDLVRYEDDGTLVFQSRIDSQVKIRGQRTELGEIERSIQKALKEGDVKAQTVADVFKPLNSANPILVAFVLPEHDDALREKLFNIDQQLGTMVPSYMIPTAYITVKEFPMTATGKIHRKSLRETYMQLTLEEITALNALYASNRLPPSTANEILLQGLWAEVLGIDPETIFADSNFLRIGGDSLGAMRLAGLARKRGLVFTVADIFKQPLLCSFAEDLQTRDGAAISSASSHIEPFSLLDLVKLSREEAKAEAARLCGLDAANIEDVFPCTSLQGGLLAETVKHPGTYVLTESWAFKDEIDRSRFKVAWQSVIQQNPILRTRIVDLPQHGLVQVVISYDTSKSNVGMDAIEFGLGTPLMSYDVSESSFNWSIHHALYDGWTSPLIFDSLAKNYRDEATPLSIPFQAFIKRLNDYPQAEADEYWRTQFAGFQAQNFPTLPTTSYSPKCDQRLTHEIEYSAVNDGFTVATRIRLAWAILLATITNSADALFGTTVSGRQADVPGIEDMVGPTIATVPLRVTVDRSSTVKALLEAVQSQAIGMVPFEQTGLQHIRRLSEDCKMGCAFQSFMIVQPESKHGSESSLFSSSVAKGKTDHGDAFRQYAISLNVDLSSESVGLQCYYDSAVVAPTQMRRLLNRFENIFKQLSLPANGSLLVSELDTSSLADLEQIWSWNDITYPRYEEKVHEMFENIAAQQPDAPAICSWDGDFTYGQLSQLSTEIAQEILRGDSFQNDRNFVSIYFEKSKWTSVCQLAVMKAGATSSMLAAELPQRRLAMMADLVKPEVILTSVELEANARELVPSTTRIIVVGDSRTWETCSSSIRLPVVHPDTWLYVNFTSGSTGVPKGAIVSHSNFTSAVRHGAKEQGFNKNARAYDFTSYAFDGSWLNGLFTLCTGGCLCIPSQYEILNEPVEAISRRRANHMLMIPSVSKLFHGAKLDFIEFAGEKPSRAEIEYWSQSAEVILGYGPSECTIASTYHPVDPNNLRMIIGKGLGSLTWIVEPESGKQLSAIGDIGELWLEGPLVGQGYLKNPEETEESFVNDPEWVLKGCPGFPGRTGRFYRTGDLVRYEEDGNIEYIGRKDAQIKIRGQRVQLEEIEHHVFNIVEKVGASQVVADIIKPTSSAEPALIAFIKPAGNKVESGTPEAFKYAQQMARLSRKSLASTVPGYMIPNGFMVVDEIPKTGSGKIDRGKLREAAVAMRKEDLLQVEHIGKRTPEAPEEIKLHSVIARVLSWDGEPFGMDNNFIQLGGDSISAMRLVAVARAEGISLSVADILSKDSLSDLLVAVQAAPAGVEDRESRFSLLDVESVDAFINGTVMPQIDSGHGELVDVLPATDMQSVYLSDNLYTPRRSWFFTYIDFDERVDTHRLIQSCERLVELCDIYRTAFVRANGSFFQAIFKSWMPAVRVIKDVEDIENSFNREVETAMNSPVQLGAPLLSFTLLESRDSKARLAFGMSHAIYDGISRRHELQLLTDLYNGSKIDGVPDFRNFVQHTRSSKADSYAYWRRSLQGSQMTILPSAANATAEGGPPTIVQSSVPMPKQPQGITQASIFTLACTSAISRIAGISDVVIGRVVSGRAAIPAHLQGVVGPCVNRVPIRVTFDDCRTKANRLSLLQKQFTESIAHETTGLMDIVKHCTEWPRDTTDFGCWIQYQNIEKFGVLDIPGAVGSLQAKDWRRFPVASDFLEIFAVASKEGELTVRIIAGPGYCREMLDELLEVVCSEIIDI